MTPGVQFFMVEHLVYFSKQTHPDYQQLALKIKSQLNTYILIIKHLKFRTEKS